MAMSGSSQPTSRYARTVTFTFHLHGGAARRLTGSKRYAAEWATAKSSLSVCQESISMLSGQAKIGLLLDKKIGLRGDMSGVAIGATPLDGQSISRILEAATNRATWLIGIIDNNPAVRGLAKQRGMGRVLHRPIGECPFADQEE